MEPGWKNDRAGPLVKQGMRERNASCLTDVRKDYRTYRFNARELVKYGGLYLLLDAGISYLFFYSVEAFFLLLPGMAVFMGEWREVLRKRRAARMRREFLDGIQTVATSLQAGYSAENAFRAAVAELAKLYEPEAFIVREFEMITAQLDRNRNLEELLMDLGMRSGIDDIRSFAEIFQTAKRMGGDLTAVIGNTVWCIRQKQDTMREIETCLSGKVMEQNVMSLMPILILAYVKLSSPDFLSVLYGNLTGLVVMVICFLVYLLAYFWGRRIVRIEV